MLLLCFWGSFGLVQKGLQHLTSNTRCCREQDWTRSEEDPPHQENSISRSKKRAEGEKVHRLRLEVVEEVLHSGRESHWKDHWLTGWLASNLLGYDKSEHVLTFGFLPQTSQVTGWADYSQGPLHAAWLPLAERQQTKSKCPLVLQDHPYHLALPTEGDDFRPWDICSREVRGLGGAATSCIRTTSELLLNPTGERGLTTSNCLHTYPECRHKSRWKSNIQFKATFAVYQSLCLPHKLLPSSFKIY